MDIDARKKFIRSECAKLNGGGSPKDGRLPVICLYPFVQKHFVKGVMIGSLKG